MTFSKLLLFALILSIIVHLAHLSGAAVPFMLFLFNLACLGTLTSYAIKFHKSRQPGFDVIVAAETVIAFGIMSLILSLTVALVPFFIGSTGGLLEPGGLRKAAVPFLEGLATAGIAPLFAMVIRNQAVEADAIVNPVGDATDLAKAMGLLSKEIAQAQKTMADLQKATASTIAATHDLTNGLESETERLKYVLAESQGHLRALGVAAQTSASEVTQVANATTRLTTAADGAGTMLEALAKLIESVERFVAPATARAPGK